MVLSEATHPIRACFLFETMICGQRVWVTCQLVSRRDEYVVKSPTIGLCSRPPTRHSTVTYRANTRRMATPHVCPLGKSHRSFSCTLLCPPSLPGYTRPPPQVNVQFSKCQRPYLLFDRSVLCPRPTHVQTIDH